MSQIAIFTGTSSGIGLATALGLAKAGLNVIATVRSERARTDVLEQAVRFGVPLDVRLLDVTNDTSVAGIVEGVLADHGCIDVLVNNAGAGHRGTLEQLTLDAMAASMDVNFWGVARMTHAVIPGMRAARRGRIVTLTSMNGLIAMPFSDARKRCQRKRCQGQLKPGLKLGSESTSFRSLREVLADPSVSPTYQNKNKRSGSLIRKRKMNLTCLLPGLFISFVPFVR